MEKIATKAALRTQIKCALKALSSEERMLQSIRVTKKVLENSFYQKSKGVAVFLSMSDEIDTRSILADVFDSGKHCYIPRYQETNGNMTMVRVFSLKEIDELPRTKWNIPQPLEDDPREDCLNFGGLDLILTPGLAFTKDGSRLGRGKGFYDRFIKKYCALHDSPYLIGLALSPSIVESIPCTPNDVKVHEVISALE